MSEPEDMKIDLSRLMFNAEFCPELDEEEVLRMIEHLRNGGAIYRPLAAKWRDGQYTPLNRRAQVEACLRLGRTEIEFDVIDAHETGREKLLELADRLRRQEKLNWLPE